MPDRTFSRPQARSTAEQKSMSPDSVHVPCCVNVWLTVCPLGLAASAGAAPPRTHLYPSLAHGAGLTTAYL